MPGWKTCSMIVWMIASLAVSLGGGAPAGPGAAPATDPALTEADMDGPDLQPDEDDGPPQHEAGPPANPRDLIPVPEPGARASLRAGFRGKSPVAHLRRGGHSPPDREDDAQPSFRHPLHPFPILRQFSPDSPRGGNHA